MPFILTTPATNYAIKYPNQINDNVLIPAYKWFSNINNKLDGSFHPIDSTNVYQVGWWGTTLSDSNGNIADQIITIKEVRSVHKLRVAGDSILNEFPVNFTIKLYNNESIVYTETIENNGNAIWYKELNVVYDVTSIELCVTKINSPNNILKIVDMFSPFEFTRRDEIRVSFSEHSAVDDAVIRDRIKLKLEEDSFICVSSKAYDTLAIKSLDASKPVVAKVYANDENLKVQVYETKKQIMNITSPEDILAVSINEKSKVKNIHTVMDSNLRQVFGKVEVTYAAPFLGDSVDIQSSQIGRYTSVAGIADNTYISEYKWASCHDNVLDGSYHPMPPASSKKYHVGLWGTELSNLDGTFNVDPIITINFESRPIYYLKVSGDDKLNNFPVDFTLQVYNSANEIMYTEEVVDNTSTLWYKELDPILNGVSKVILTIHKISKASQVFKITEFFNSIVETYYNNGIVSLHLLEEMDYVESSITLGAVSSNELDVVLDNSTGKFNIMDPSIPLYNLIKRNRKVRAWLGAEIVPDVIDWYPLGTFYTTKWDIPDRSLTAKLTARDILDVLNYSDFSSSMVYKNKSIGELYRIVLDDAGLVDGSDYKITASITSTIIPYAWFSKMSHREALQRISGCTMVQLYCDRDGTIIITDMAPTEEVFYTFTDTRSVISKDFPFVWNEITNYVEVSANIFYEGDLKKVLETKETIILEANSTIDLKYDYNTSPVLSIEQPLLVCDDGIVINSFDSFSNGIRIQIANISSVAATLTNITVNGIPLEKQSTSICIAKDINQIKENGTLKTSIAHDFIQSTTYANKLASDLLAGYKDSRYDVKLNCRGNIGLYLRERVNVEDFRLKQTKPYAIKRQTIDWDGTLKAVVECKNIN